MNIIFMIISIASCVFIGFWYSGRFIKREKLFRCTCTFLEKLKTNVSFSKDELSRVVYAELENSDGELYDILKEYYIMLCSHELIDYTSLKKNIKCRALRENELELYCQMLSMLGKSHAKSQIDELEFFIGEAMGFHSAAKVDKEKYVGMYRKLGVYLGIGFAIFFL